jgi:hypothetical protein
VTSPELAADNACSFCLKSPADVQRMVAGAGVYICNECVDLCNQLIAMPKEQGDKAIDARQDQLSDEEILAHLPRVARTSKQVEHQLTIWVRRARSRGITWTRIGEALGMTRQSAWERFSGED